METIIERRKNMALPIDRTLLELKLAQSQLGMIIFMSSPNVDPKLTRAFSINEKILKGL